MQVTDRNFIVFEGPDFSGKSTLHKAVAKRLREQGIEPVVVREPGGTELGERLRKVILSEYNETVHPETDILMHMAYRTQNVREIISPALKEGRWVLVDRFLYSTWCLNVQRFLDTHPQLPDLFMALMPTVTGGIIPEPFVFIVKTPKEVRIQRRDARAEAEGLDRMELLSEEIQVRIDASYEQLEQGPSTLVIDGMLPIEEQVDFVLNAVKEHHEKIIEASKAKERLKEEINKINEEVKDEPSTQPSIEPDFSEDQIKDEFDLETTLVQYAEQNIVDGLFDEVPTAELEETKAHYKEVAIDIARDIYRLTNNDKTIFSSSRVGQLNQKIHSLIHYGHKLKTRETQMASRKVAQGCSDESTAG